MILEIFEKGKLPYITEQNFSLSFYLYYWNTKNDDFEYKINIKKGKIVDKIEKMVKKEQNNCRKDELDFIKERLIKSDETHTTLKTEDVDPEILAVFFSSLISETFSKIELLGIGVSIEAIKPFKRVKSKGKNKYFYQTIRQEIFITNDKERPYVKRVKFKIPGGEINYIVMKNEDEIKKCLKQKIPCYTGVVQEEENSLVFGCKKCGDLMVQTEYKNEFLCLRCNRKIEKCYL